LASSTGDFMAECLRRGPAATGAGPG